MRRDRETNRNLSSPPVTETRARVPVHVATARQDKDRQPALRGPPNETDMDIRVSYEHSLASAPEDFLIQVPSQLVTNIPANVPRALLPEFIANLILERSPMIGKIRNLRIL